MSFLVPCARCGHINVISWNSRKTGPTTDPPLSLGLAPMRSKMWIFSLVVVVLLTITHCSLGHNRYGMDIRNQNQWNHCGTGYTCHSAGDRSVVPSMSSNIKTNWLVQWIKASKASWIVGSFLCFISATKTRQTIWPGFAALSAVISCAMEKSIVVMGTMNTTAGRSNDYHWIGRKWIKVNETEKRREKIMRTNATTHMLKYWLLTQPPLLFADPSAPGSSLTRSRTHFVAFEWRLTGVTSKWIARTAVTSGIVPPVSFLTLLLETESQVW